MTVVDKLTRIAKNEQKVYKAGRDAGYTEGLNKGGYADGYEQGKKEEYDAFWDAFTRNGDRTNYQYAFYYWGNEYLHPNRKIIPTFNSSGYLTFAYAKFKKIEAQYIDFSQKPIGTRFNQSYYYTCSNCSNLEEIEDIGFQADFGYEAAFMACGKLHTIAKIRTKEDTVFVDTFAYNHELQNIAFEGVIGQNIDFKWSTKLSADSIRNIIEHLSLTASGKTLTLSKTAVENAIANGEFGGDTVYMTTDGAFGSYLYSNPIPLTAGQRIKIEAEWKEGYDFDSNDALDWWFDSTGDGQTEDDATLTPGYQLPRYYTATGDEQHVFGWYFDSNVAVSNIPIKIRAVLVDEDGNEITGENLHSFVTNTVTDNGTTLTITDDSWETLQASKPNWTITLV